MRATHFNSDISYEDFFDDSRKRTKKKVWTDIEVIDDQVVIYVWDFGNAQKSYILSYHSLKTNLRKIVSKAEYKQIGGDIYKSIFVLDMNDIADKEIQLEVFGNWRCIHRLMWNYDSDRQVFVLNRL